MWSKLQGYFFFRFAEANFLFCFDYLDSISKNAFDKSFFVTSGGLAQISLSVHNIFKMLL